MILYIKYNSFEHCRVISYQSLYYYSQVSCISHQTSNQKHINRIKKLYEERKDEFKYLVENPDGSVCAKIPLKWIKINADSKTGRVMTEEQKEAARIRLQKARENKNKNK